MRSSSDGGQEGEGEEEEEEQLAAAAAAAAHAGRHCDHFLLHQPKEPHSSEEKNNNKKWSSLLLHQPRLSGDEGGGWCQPLFWWCTKKKREDSPQQYYCSEDDDDDQWMQQDYFGIDKKENKWWKYKCGKLYRRAKSRVLSLPWKPIRLIAITLLTLVLLGSFAVQHSFDESQPSHLAAVSAHSPLISFSTTTTTTTTTHRAHTGASLSLFLSLCVCFFFFLLNLSAQIYDLDKAKQPPHFPEAVKVELFIQELRSTSQESLFPEPTVVTARLVVIAVAASPTAGGVLRTDTYVMQTENPPPFQYNNSTTR